jgi:hypothetical protein
VPSFRPNDRQHAFAADAGECDYEPLRLKRGLAGRLKVNPENTGDRKWNPVVQWTTTLCVATAVVLLTFAPSTGQWLKYPTPGIPRGPDGEPDLSAPTPRTADGKPDLSGLWQPNAGGYQINVTADLSLNEFRPWAAALTKQRAENLASARQNPVALCLPPGPSLRAMTAMVKIVQTRSLIVMLYESGTLDRQIFMDGRRLPEDPNPTWMGYSVGRWEDETLVVESAGFNDRSWLDLTGHPHTEELRVTERFTRRDFGHMHLAMTIDDSRAYARPFTIPVDLRLAADTELLEEVCNENERDAARISGAKMSVITLSSRVLSSFSGTYEVTAGAPGRAVRFAAGTAFVVTFIGDQVMLQRPGDKIGLPLAPVSDTHFVLIGGGADIEFIKNAEGTVTELFFQSVEGEARALRKSK